MRRGGHPASRRNTVPSNSVSMKKKSDGHSGSGSAVAARQSFSSTSMVTGLRGEKYEGDVNAEGKRHGKGTLSWPNGNRYIGYWREGKMCGAGIFTYGVEGDRYDGEFNDDKKHGKGCYTFANGNKYSGEFHNDKRHGNGKYHWVCGDMYSGEWREGRMEGIGTTVYANGNRYEGSFKEDKREGKGKLICVDGLIFEGEWEDNMRHGYGVLVFPSGDRYEGLWKEDRKHGEGRDIFSNGNTFIGNYEDNVKSGKGIMRYANSDEYNGDWKDDKMHGEGTYRFGNGFMYTGSWSHDCRSGHGVYTFPNKNKYAGNWRDDKRHGSGIFEVAKTNETYSGSWNNGKMEGKFTVTQQGKERYQGHWVKGMVTGKGTITINGCRFHGEWDSSSEPAKTDGTIDIPSTLPEPLPAEAELDVRPNRGNHHSHAGDFRNFTDLANADLARDLHDANAVRLSHLSEVENQLDQYKSINVLLQEQLSDAAEQQIKESGEEKDIQIESLSSELKKTQTDLKKSLQSNDGLKDKYAVMQKEFESLQSAKAALDKDFLHTKREASEATRLKRELKESQKSNEAAGTDRNKKTDQLKQAQVKIHSLEQELNRLKVQFKQKREAESDAKRVQIEEEAANRKKRIEEIETDLKKISKDYSDSLKEAENLRTVNKSLKESISKKHEEGVVATADAAKQREELDRVEKVLESEKQSHETTRRTSSSLEHQIITMKAELSDLQVDVKKRENTNTELNTKLQSYSVEASQTEKLQSLNANYEKELCSKRQQIEALASNLTEQSTNTTKLKEEITQLSAELQCVSLLKSELESKEREKEGLFNQLQGYIEKDKVQPSTRDEVTKLTEELKKLVEVNSDLSFEVKQEKLESKTLKEDLASEKKRRKRAERSQENGASAEALRNQVVHLRAEIEKKERDNTLLRSTQNKHHDELLIRSHASNNTEGDLVICKEGDVAWRIKYLSEQVEDKERQLEEQRSEVTRVKSLEAKLISANLRIQGLSQSAQIDRNRDYSISLSESERWQTRAMINEERHRISEAERKEVNLINANLLERKVPSLRSLKGSDMSSSPSADFPMLGLAKSDSCSSWRPKPPNIRPALTRNYP